MNAGATIVMPEVRTIKLNKLATSLAIFVAALTLLNAYGSWHLLPYRLDHAEKKIQELQSDLDTVRSQQQASRELLVRIDERTEAIMRAFKIAEPQR